MGEVQFPQGSQRLMEEEPHSFVRQLHLAHLEDLHGLAGCEGGGGGQGEGGGGGGGL